MSMNACICVYSQAVTGVIQCKDTRIRRTF